MADAHPGWTAGTWLVIAQAEAEARRRGHAGVGDAHLLLGLLADDEATAMLRELGAEPPRVRNALEFILGRGEGLVPDEAAPSARAQAVLALALEEAKRLGAQRVAPPHLVAGILRDFEGISAGVLEALGVSLEAARRLLEWDGPRGG